MKGVSTMTIITARIYDDDQPTGFRILIDRIWPRGIKKTDAKLDLWDKEIAPSTELRKWFGHDPERFSEFKTRFEQELTESGAVTKLAQQIQDDQPENVVLLYAAKDREHNNAVVLLPLLQQALK
ncbi:hypothetical protein FC26_GL001333 [Paucilactobacillus vaccinostercus DSM 20634]|uniref:Uroporphyrin-III c-methyltransferase n=2 Tax=Paucilactobacillus vaccinostercus TaxID=176291 RepID=A0A0R2ADJ7_9LACO|nr:hypothetical protein FC26_GL001333 [Paucilactobacillus vaccinostercus DSM 20634]